MTSPKITVVVPVYNREIELYRALRSVQGQTFQDFECIVVDDGSTIQIQPIVKSLEASRFLYLRNDINGGPYNACTCGYRAMKGEYCFLLHSDWEIFPWALDQAVTYLDDTPEVDAVTGMHLRNHDSKLFVRVTNNRRIVTPKDYVKMSPVPDCVGAVRKKIVDEWLLKRTDYFALESHQWLTFGLNHNQLYVDEPWTRYYVEGADRVSLQMDERRLDDFIKFSEEHARYIEEIECAPLDRILLRGWASLKKAGRTERAKVFEQYLKSRNVNYKKALLQGMFKKLRNGAVSLLKRLLRRQRSDATYYI